MTKYNVVMCCYDKNLGKCGHTCNSAMNNVNIIQYNVVRKVINYIDYFDGLTLFRCVCVCVCGAE